MPFPSLFPDHGPPPALPFVGHALALRRDPLRLLTALTREHGGMAPLRLGPLRGYLLSEPELVGQVFVAKKKHYSRQTPVYRAMAEFLGDGILTTEGADWRTHRRIVQPAFHKRRLARFTGDIARIGDEMLSRWRGELDVSDAMMRLTLRIVSEVLLGTRTDRDASDIGRAIDESQRYAEGVMGRLAPLPDFVPTPRDRAFRRARATLDRVAYGIIDARRAADAPGDDVVGMLLEARYEDGRPLSRQRIRNELLTLLAAGHETTANALSWTLMRLSLHPEVARRLAAEVDEVLGDRLPTFDDLPRLTYTRRVFDEAMRLHPPAWVTGRVVTVGHELGGVTMRPEDFVLISPYVTHRRPDLWENPEGFDPDRWEALSKKGALKPFTFYPFGGGSRKCVGEAFAYLEATVLLALLAQRFRLELVGGRPIVPAPQITLGLASGLFMRVVPRAPAAPPSVTRESRAPAA
jgi:cytochrome P450